MNKTEWKWNPKTKGSGIITCIPQSGKCPNNCADCFFQGGRSYLEPLNENLPHIPPQAMTIGRIVRINDGNDSNVKRKIVEKTARQFDNYFFNTALIDSFYMPYVFTINGGDSTDKSYIALAKIPRSLMFVRVRTNTWNMHLVRSAIEWYTIKQVPIILTFMAYYTTPIPEEHKKNYVYRKRTLNSYWAITTKAWRKIMNEFKDNIWVYSCGKIEGEKGNTKCSRCGNCIREYYNTKERLRG